MNDRTYSIRVDPNTWHRLTRLHLGTGTLVRKLANALLRDYLDRTQRCVPRISRKR